MNEIEKTMKEMSLERQEKKDTTSSLKKEYEVLKKENEVLGAEYQRVLSENQRLAGVVGKLLDMAAREYANKLYAQLYQQVEADLNKAAELQ